MSGSRTSSSVGAGLTKNSTISVTVDDFAEGVIVVSYPHQDNLFQGVLFELNRERGIPAGISFPKDYFTCESKTDFENDPSQIVPLTQRHTYFQDNSLGKQIRSLRRVIKTPARYKHSRMSLRPVQRPVLCAKCGSQCKEKSPDEDEDRNKTVLTSKSKVNNGIPPKKATTKNMKSETDDSFNNPNTKESSDGGPNSQSQNCDDKKDYIYESVGSSTMVENVWRRPLAKPIANISRNKDVFQNPGPTTSTNKGKKIIRLVPNVVNAVLKTSLSKTTAYSRNDNQNDTGSEKVATSLDNLTLSSLLASGPVAPVPVFRISRSPTSHKLSPSKISDQKTDNLKLCITKLKTVNSCQGKSLNPDNVSSTSAVADSVKAKPPSELKLQSTQPRCRSRKRSSTYPIRPVDVNSVKQSQPKKSKLEPKSRSRRKVKIPVKSLPVQNVELHTPFPSQKRFTVNNKTQTQDFNGELSSPDQIKPETYLSTSGNQLSKGLEGSDTGKHLTSTKAEPTKTPVIKITFGSLGNGIVVQIPPKTTEEMESANISESKASRKAMKKAKKEARRKHLVSLITSPSSSNAFSPLTLQPTISHSSLSSPVLEMEELPKLISEDSPSESLKVGGASTSTDPKKKHKKGKKKKKEKDHSATEYSKRGSCSQSSSVSSGESPLSSRNVTIKQKPSSPEKNCSVGELSGKSNQGNCPSTLKTVHAAVPASDSLQQGEKQTEAHHRLCISLRRLNTNAYIPWPSHEEGSETIVESTENEDPIQLSIKTVEESEILRMSKANSIESFQDSESNQFYRKGDVIWGNSLGCLWWPGKIVDILQDSSDGIRAKVSWYNAMTESFLKFQQLLPFIKNFDKKFIRSRSPNRGPYQQAVQNALLDAHNCNQEDLHHD